jgi:hypothetical protein
MSIELFPIKTSNTQPFPLICSWKDLPSSNTTMLAHAFYSPTKVIEFGHALSCLHLLSTLARLSHVLISWMMKSLHFKMASYWTFLQHPQSSHTPQIHMNSIHFQWSTHEHVIALSWSETIPIHTFSTLTKVTMFGQKPFYCICQMVPVSSSFVHK